MSGTCSECNYYRPEEKDKLGNLKSASCCLRYPPQIVALPRAHKLQPNVMRVSPVAVRPAVDPSDTCGEFKLGFIPPKEKGPSEDGPYLVGDTDH